MKTQIETIQETEHGILLRVAGGSNSSRVAGAIFKYMQEGMRVSISAMGAGAINQAVKAIAISRGMAAPNGWDIFCIPGFSDVYETDGTKKTAIIFRILRK